MTAVTANGITIEYDERGDKRAPAILLVHGLGAQMTRWSDDFLDRLAANGFRVVRFDNRDVGLSQKFEAAGIPNMMETMQKAAQGQPVDAPYRLEDMAKDAIGLLDHLQIARAHVVGVSMGGMIVQTLAGLHGPRISSMISIMSSSGRRGLPPGKPEAMQAITSRPATNDREALVLNSMKAHRTIGSPLFPEDEGKLRAMAEINIDRCYYPQGVARQFAAIIASGSRVDMLKTIRTPSLVIHGVDDPLVPVEAGKDTAANIPVCDIELVAGMGHAIETPLVPRITDMILNHCRKAMALA